MKTSKNIKNSVTYGPVESLESHLKSDWWHSIFNHLYLKTDGDVVEDRTITSSETELFSTILDLPKASNILDLCCGQGRHSLELSRLGYLNIEGLDRSQYLIRRARNQAKLEGLKVKFKEGDARKLPYQDDHFDAVMILGNSFGYFESSQDDEKVIHEIRRVLKPDGKLLLDICDGEYMRNNFKDRSWEWIDKRYFVCRERSLSSDGQRLISREVITSTTKGIIADQFYAERLYTRDSISQLLNAANFSNTLFHSEWKPDSLRGMDLGMMEQRLIISSIIQKDWSPKKRSAISPLSTIVVVMGDPNQRDILKPNHVFDDDDFYTISQLKASLERMDGKKFIYLDDHKTVYSDLLKLKDKIHLVLNLCDEGFNNDPRKELHIPAMLETLSIPYTGSGPQSLAYCYDKSLVRGIACELGINVPAALIIGPDDTTFDLPVQFPLIIKPNFGDSSFGITSESVVYSGEELFKAIQTIRDRFGYDKTVIAEEFLQGKDLTFGVIGAGTPRMTILPILEEDYSLLPDNLPKICGYEAKWCPDSPYWKIQSVIADIPEKTIELITKWSLALGERLECKDYFRVDWRLNGDGAPHLLEVNPNPGWCWDGHLAKMSAQAGISYEDMLEQIVAAAECRLYSPALAEALTA